MKIKPLDWLVDDLWQVGKINAMAGAEKSGKSRLLAWFLVGMHRPDVLGLRATAPAQRILYLCGEETKETVNQRITDYAQLQGVANNLFDITFVEAAAMRLDLATQRKWLHEKILDEDYTMLVADPLRRLHGADENDSTAMSHIHNDLRRWSNKNGLTILLVHHTPKINDDTDMERMASWLRGSSDTAAILDTAQYIARKSKTEIQMLRAGRMPPLPPMNITDAGDNVGFSLKLTQTKGGK